MLTLRPVTWRQLPGWVTTLPLGTDLLRTARTLDTAALAAAFPFTAPGLPAPLPTGTRATGTGTGGGTGGGGDPDGVGGGVLMGVTGPPAGGVVWWDRWAQDNHNTVVLARSGAGKSYLVKLDVLRSLYTGVRVAVIDPDDEYQPLADAVGGTVHHLGTPARTAGDAGTREAGPGGVNPLALTAAGRVDAVTRRALFVHTLIGVLLGEQLPPTARSVLDTAILSAYRAAGITADPATHTRPAPVMADLHTVLAGSGDPAGREFAARLEPWITGSHAALFTPAGGPPRPAGDQGDGPLVVWSLRHLPDELRPAGMLLALDAIWAQVDTPPPGGGPLPRRLVVVDEAWTLLRDGHGAAFLYRLAKTARKRRTGLTVITQDAADLLGSDLGRAVAANAATGILLRQSPAAISAVTAAFDLTAGEARLLLTAGRGFGLLLAGTHRTTVHAVGSAAEHALASPLDHPGPRPGGTDRGGW
jgi:hypothetical protein